MKPDTYNFIEAHCQARGSDNFGWLEKRIASSRGYAGFYRGVTADLDVLSKALPSLPETADELRAVAKSLGAGEADLKLGSAATETAVKQTKLDQYRIVYFATHALVSGETEQAAKGLAEPALVLSLPATATALDDGLLTSSEVAQLVNIRQQRYDDVNNARYCVADFQYQNPPPTDMALALFMSIPIQDPSCAKSFTYKIETLLDKPDSFYVSWKCIL